MRIWDAVPGEFDLALDEITGRLPEGLTGTLYRNGSGRWDVGPTAVDCLFDTDGMIGAFALDGRGVRFRNRFVRTRQYTASVRAGRLTTRGLGRQRPGGIAANMLRPPANTANTSVLVRDDRVLALWEAGRPHELDADTLETRGTTDLGGVLKGLLGAYSAHYRHDPETGAVVNFGFDPYLPRVDPRWVHAGVDAEERRSRLRETLAEARPRMRLRLYETDKAGVTRYLRAVPLAGFPLMHDMALTRSHHVFAATPMRFDPVPIVTGTAPMMESLNFAPRQAAVFLLVPRDGGPVRTVETDPFFFFHFVNAYDEGTDVVIDLVRYAPETFENAKAFFADVRRAEAAVGRLTRYRIRPSGAVETEFLSGAAVEAPQFDLRLSAAEHRYSYALARTDGVTAPLGPGFGIARFDHRTGATDAYATPDDVLVEPVFVPREPGAAEDDGWILSVGYHAPSHRSRLMVFDAAHLPDGPLAEAWLPFHLPFNFHGAFTPRVARL
ncbi:carotenoid oxygenase family protein [Actinocorallia aurea]